MFIKWLVQSFNGLSCLLKGDMSQCESSENCFDAAPNMNLPFISCESGAGGTRAGLFRTPISGGVQSATSAHGLPRPALAVRNLMEQVKATFFISSFPVVVFHIVVCGFPHRFIYVLN